MHPLVPAVLLRMTRFDPFDADAEPEPPYRQPREPVQRVAAAERESVVGANGAREAKLLEGPFEDRKYRRRLRRGERFTANEIPAGEIRDRERKAIAPIAELKFPLEVGAPQFVRLHRPG